eukprot:4103301-Amphidinium_carterae.2
MAFNDEASPHVMSQDFKTCEPALNFLLMVINACRKDITSKRLEERSDPHARVQQSPQPPV